MSLFTQVKTMMEAFGQTVRNKPTLPSDNERALRIRLLREEFEEYLKAEENNDLVEIADALSDLQVIASGTGAAYGIDIDAVNNEVMRSNLAKIVDGKVLKREDGKVIKPEGWTPPDIAGVLSKANKVR